MDDPKQLPTVAVTAKRIDPKKYKVVKEKVKIYPNKEVEKYKIDSLFRRGYGKAIGMPLKESGKMDMFSADQGDVINKLLSKK